MVILSENHPSGRWELWVKERSVLSPLHPFTPPPPHSLFITPIAPYMTFIIFES